VKNHKLEGAKFPQDCPLRNERAFFVGAPAGKNTVRESGGIRNIAPNISPSERNTSKKIEFGASEHFEK